MGPPVLLPVGATSVPARVAAVAPYLPSSPAGPAILADRDALSRLLLARGDLTSLTDRWWVAGVGPQAEALANALRIGSSSPV